MALLDISMDWKLAEPVVVVVLKVEAPATVRLFSTRASVEMVAEFKVEVLATLNVFKVVEPLTVSVLPTLTLPGQLMLFSMMPPLLNSMDPWHTMF